jgi:hypothetical protein
MVSSGQLSELDIREAALERVSRVFSRPVSSLSMGDTFGEQLDASFVSDFTDNELDSILNDLRDAAGGFLSARLSSGELTIRTVEDYCNFMIVAYRSNPAAVVDVLSIRGRE